MLLALGAKGYEISDGLKFLEKFIPWSQIGSKEATFPAEMSLVILWIVLLLPQLSTMVLILFLLEHSKFRNIAVNLFHYFFWFS